MPPAPAKKKLAGPGGGPPRRSHTKSRKGCKTCKRRHIRCDESFPQCRNCTKHSCRCDYLDAPNPEDERARSPQTPQSANLPTSPDVERELAIWRQTGISPFPALRMPLTLMPQSYSASELRLLHHICSISQEMQLRNTNRYTIWTAQIPTLLRMVPSNNFIMSAILALSASHLAWVSEDLATRHLAFQHRALALKGLQEGIGRFSKENSEAILAASIILSWQPTDWRGWVSLMQGTSSVIDAMAPWKHESAFTAFMHEQSTFPTAPATPNHIEQYRSREPRREDLNALQHIYKSLQRVEEFVVQREEESRGISELMNFVRNLRPSPPVSAAGDQFDMLHPLRAWLLWLPVSFLQKGNYEASALVMLAHFYAVALALDPIYAPASGAPFFASLSIAPIEEISNTLLKVPAVPGREAEHHTAISLMEFPLQMVANFRNRMGWSQQLQSATPTTVYQNYAPGPYGVEHLDMPPHSEPLEYTHDYGSMAYTAGNPAMHPRQPMSPAVSSPMGYTQAPSRGLPPVTTPQYAYTDVAQYAAYGAVRQPARIGEDEGTGADYGQPPMQYNAAMGGFVPQTLWT
ncbi:MAG: hypothetical protein M1829_005182 [Trizodia sp. TS-e1964]|nr:MAG: hypothetical protein M1829_005182 [Trizodia sp. TS-e1964]